MRREMKPRSNVANVALDMLMRRDINQREFTQTTYLGGENGGGLTRVDGIDPTDPFEVAIS